ncbi:hypothetical protein G7062_07585 [Erysipelothrix sp. HDW6C]|uniref:type II secretion system F family protein n=1 Tax=Erysipelothrix sp. HDW6C TaxID=2714930 RepID=UPI00140D6DDF|nr:type II secretion system F family protein [Erysipelothrix sp. HDW6C]QIK70155.1 hypothetical protein G7062_07585 [Erysipelothrix sp. HDW6C]
MKLQGLKQLKDYWTRQRLISELEMIVIHLNINADITEFNTLHKTSFTSLEDLTQLLLNKQCETQLEPFIILKLLSKQNEVKKQFIKECTTQLVYPLILGMVSIAMMIFYVLGLSTMISDMVVGYSVDVSSIWIFQRIFVLIITALLLLIVILSTVLCLRKSLWPLIRVGMFRKQSLIKIICTLSFVEDLMVLRDENLPWQKSVEQINKLNINSIKKWQSYAVLTHLESGESFQTAFDAAYFDMTLSRQIRYTDSLDNIDEMLQRYCLMSRALCSRMIKRQTDKVKLVIYLLVIVVVVAFYSALMVPMKIMEVL